MSGSQRLVRLLVRSMVCQSASKISSALRDSIRRWVCPLYDLMSSRLITVLGYTSWIGKKAEKNCTLVDILLSAGAVPFVRTNVPQTLMVCIALLSGSISH